MEFGYLSVEQMLSRFLGIRKRTLEIFDLLPVDAFDCQPIPLRHPIRFYEGHLAAFNANLLWSAGYLRERPSPAFSGLFARGIDPDSQGEARELQIRQWPERSLVKAYIAGIDDLMLSALRSGGLYEHLMTCLEHEEMHQETLLYLIHQLAHEWKLPPAAAAPDLSVPAYEKRLVPVPYGWVQLGTDPRHAPFAWDNELPAMQVPVSAFRMESHKVTNDEFRAFVDAGGYEQPEWWGPASWDHIIRAGVSAPSFWQRQGGEWYYRGLFDSFPLPPAWPAFVSHIEAAAYARWRGMRLPTEAEFQRAAYPHSDARSGRDHDGANVDFRDWNCRPVGRSDEPCNELGLAELVGNGWEWTASPFAGFPGFVPMSHYPEYSADFFDGRHYVAKGGSPFTASALLRPGFRNWYRDHYRYAYTSFRCVAAD